MMYVLEKFISISETAEVCGAVKETLRNIYECPGEGPSDNRYCLNYQFKRLTSPTPRCEGNVTLLLVVTSKTNNFRKRDILRRTWCTDLNVHFGSVRHVFLLGNATSKQEQKAIDKEAERYGDILQDDFKDAYRNLTLKTIMAFHWFAQHCSNARFLMKTDDDMFINTLAILKMVQPPGAYNNTMFGYCFTNPKKIMRQQQSKWFVPYQQYPGRWWPRYCDGTGYILPTKLALDVEHLIPTLPIITTEDAFVGECVERLNGEISHIPNFARLITNWPLNATIKSIQSGATISIHRVDIKLVKPLWNETMIAWNK